MKFSQPAEQATLADYVNEVEHCSPRIARLEKEIDEAMQQTPEGMREVIEALQALRGVAKVTAVTIVAEVGILSRFQSPRQLMGYSGTVSSEYSSGQKTRRGGITKTGNAYLRRVIVEAAWAQRYKPLASRKVREGQKCLSAEVQEIATKARHRLHTRYMRLLGRGKSTLRSTASAHQHMKRVTGSACKRSRSKAIQSDPLKSVYHIIILKAV